MEGFGRQCGFDESNRLVDQAKLSVAWQPLGRDRVFSLAVQPTVTTVKIAASDGTSLTVAAKPLPERPDGPRYAAFDVPAAATAVVATLIDAAGQAIPHGATDLLQRPRT